MTIRYTPSAAAISWVALAEAMKKRAEMEGDLFTLFGNNTNLVMKETALQANNAKIRFDQMAEQTIVEGISGMASAVTSFAAAGVCSYMAHSNYAKASPSKEIEVTATQKGTESQEMNEPKKKNDPDKARRKQYQATGQRWEQHSNMIAQGVSSLTTGIGSFFKANTQNKQGEAQAQENMAQGLSSVFNSQGGLFTSALSSCDSSMQNTNSTLSTIIQVSAVRG